MASICFYGSRAEASWPSWRNRRTTRTAGFSLFTSTWGSVSHSWMFQSFKESTPRHVVCQLVRMSVFRVLQVVNQFLLSVFFFPGDLAALQVPQKNVEVIQGKTVVLQASYTSADNKKNTVVWNYMSSSTDMVTVFCYILLFFVCVGSDSSVL